MPGLLPLYAGFFYTGAMTVLLGAMLPRIAALHHLRDSQSGALLLSQFAASAAGALLVRRRFGKTLMRGYLLMALGAVALLLMPAAWAAAALVLFGLGLGMAMTSTSMLVTFLFPNARGSALSILNFCWSLGATACPMIVARMPGNYSLVAVCAPVAVLSAALAAVFLRTSWPAVSRENLLPTRLHKSAISIVVIFAAMAFLYVGTEATVGGWMSIYAARVAAWSFARSNLVAACFWAALLIGRGVTPAILLLISESRLHLISVVGASVGILVLALAHDPALLLAGACCTGLMLAPIFPLTISLFISRSEDTRNAGWVFAVGGFGGAVLPWLTGLLSTAAHSLRTGLLVSLAADLGMLPLLLLVISSRPRTRLEQIATDS
jgi:MFS transporter, FHS family, glucose/mannose:H+ symporter